jgi:hypothetical protein
MNIYLALFAIFSWYPLFLEWKHSHFYLSLQFWLKCKDSHGEIFFPFILVKMSWKIAMALFWFSVFGKCRQWNFSTDKNEAGDGGNKISILLRTASVSEILCLNRTKFVFDKIIGLFHCLHSYYRNVTNFE